MYLDKMVKEEYIIGLMANLEHSGTNAPIPTVSPLQEIAAQVETSKTGIKVLTPDKLNTLLNSRVDFKYVTMPYGKRHVILYSLESQPTTHADMVMLMNRLVSHDTLVLPVDLGKTQQDGDVINFIRAEMGSSMKDKLGIQGSITAADLGGKPFNDKHITIATVRELAEIANFQYPDIAVSTEYDIF